MKKLLNPENIKKYSWPLGAVFVLILTITLVVGQGNNRPDSSTNGSEPLLVQGTAIVPSGKGVYVTVPTGDSFVYIPANALQPGYSIVIITREPNLFPEDPTEAKFIWVRPHIVNVTCSDSEGTNVPDLKFNSPIEICFTLNDNEWARYLNLPRDHQIQYLDQEGSNWRWVGLETIVYKDRQALCSKVDHLTLFALAIRGAPLPVTGDDEIYSP